MTSGVPCRIVLTGHTRGLGAAFAELCLERGWPMLALARGRHAGLAGRFGELLQEVAIDLADTAALSRWLEGNDWRTFLAGDGPAWLVNNAGLLQPVALGGAQDSAQLAAAVAVNVTAPLLLTNAFLRATGSAAERRVVHVSSGAARSAYAGWSAYCATKAALDRHAEALAMEHHPGLRIASVAPGVIDTAMQGEIRAAVAGDFPEREKFVALKNSGQLSDPREAAQRLVDYIADRRFGTSVLADIRQAYL